MWVVLFLAGIGYYLYRESTKLPRPAMTYIRKEDEPIVPIVPLTTGEIVERHTGPFAAYSLSTANKGINPLADVPNEQYPDMIKHLNYTNQLKNG